MRDITRAMFKRLIAEDLDAVEFLDLRMPGWSAASTIRITNAGEQLEFGGQTYYALNMSRTLLREVVSSEVGDQPGLTVTISNVDRQMANLLNSVELDGSSATMRMIDRRLLAVDPSRTRDAIDLIIGEVRNPVLSQETLIFEIKNVMGILERISVPRRTFATKCGVPFGSTACGVDIHEAPFTLQSTAASQSTRNYIRLAGGSATALLAAAGNPANPDDFWQYGYVTWIDGINAGQSAPFQHYEAGGGLRLIHVRYPFLNAPASGDAFLIRRGCPKTPIGCEERQGDVLNHKGFPTVPLQVQPVQVAGIP